MAPGARFLLAASLKVSCARRLASTLPLAGSPVWRPSAQAPHLCHSPRLHKLGPQQERELAKFL